jgi:hypothetical protein
MIRGIVGIVPHHAMEAGRFYMAPAYRDGNWLFQCVQTSEPLDDGFRRKALFMTAGGQPDLGLHELPQQTPVALLDNVHVRVDPTSLASSAFDTSLRSGLFLIRDDEAIICAPAGQRRGWTAVNINTGRTVSGDVGVNWLSFTRWSLVMDDEEGDELTLATFVDELASRT